MGLPDFSSRHGYIAAEGVFFAVLCVISILLCFITVLGIVGCLKKMRNNRRFIAGAHFKRAGEILNEAESVLQQPPADPTASRTQNGDSAENEPLMPVSGEQPAWFNSGKELQQYGDFLMFRKNEQKITAKDISTILKNNQQNYHVFSREVADMLHRVNDLIMLAASGLDEDEKKHLQDAITCLEKNTKKSKTCCKKREKCCSKIFKERCQEAPSTFLALYKAIFRSVEEVRLHPTTRREFLIGGYRNPRKPYMVHVYYMAMLVVVFNWFLIMVIDNALFRKTTTCNDLSEDDAFMCFDIRKSIYAGPVDCNDDGIEEIPVLCFLTNNNLPNALSLAVGISHLVLLGIHLSFTLTVWCVKNCSPYAALSLNLVVTFGYVVTLIGYGSAVIANTNDIQYSETWNLFYGFRVMRIVMAIWGFVTLILILFFSPYWWLIDKQHHYYLPTYTDKRKEKGE